MNEKIKNSYEVLNSLGEIIDEIVDAGRDTVLLPIYYISQDSYKYKKSKFDLSQDRWKLINKFEIFINAYYTDILNALDILILEEGFKLAFTEQISAIYEKRFPEFPEEYFETEKQSTANFDAFLSAVDYHYKERNLSAHLKYIYEIFESIFKL